MASAPRLEIGVNVEEGRGSEVGSGRAGDGLCRGARRSKDDVDVWRMGEAWRRTCKVEAASWLSMNYETGNGMRGQGTVDG